jgi:type IV pilus assembly protein PilC
VAIYRYEAADVSGKILRGAMEAVSSQDVSRRLADRGFRQIHVLGEPSAEALARPTAYASVPTRSALAFGAASPAQIGSFFRQLAALIHAGFTVPSALADLGPRTGHRGLRNAAAAMAAATMNGGSLAGQMAHYPALFAANVVGLVSAGETGGFVEFAFEEAALGAEQDAALQQGMWLPKVLIWNAVWTVLLMQPLFPGIDTSKLTTGDPRAVAGAFGGYEHSLTIVIPIGIALHIGAFVIGRLRHQPFAERAFDAASLRIPVMARLARMRALAAFTRVLRRLLMSGISPAPAYAAAAGAAPNAILREQFGRGIPIARGGQSLDAALQATGLMEHDSLQMLVTGQRTGQWVEMLDRVTAYYQEEAGRATDAARIAQKRLGYLLTLIVTGYVICVTTAGCYRLTFNVADEMAK